MLANSHNNKSGQCKQVATPDRCQAIDPPASISSSMCQVVTVVGDNGLLHPHHSGTNSAPPSSRKNGIPPRASLTFKRPRQSQSIIFWLGRRFFGVVDVFLDHRCFFGFLPPQPKKVKKDHTGCEID